MYISVIQIMLKQRGGPYKIGWSYSCNIPCGIANNDKNYVTSRTCIIKPNFWKVILNAITTLGISEAMQDSFCSAEIGNQKLEGGILKHTYLDSCNGLDMKAKQECYSSLLKGDIPNTDSAGKQATLSRNMTNSLCEGLPDMDKPVVDSNGRFVFDGGRQLYCPMTRCSIPTDHIISKYFDPMGTRVGIIAAIGGSTFGFLGGLIGAIVAASAGDCTDGSILRVGEDASVAFLGAVKIRAVEEDGLLCTQMKFAVGWTTLSCKQLLGSKVDKPKTKNCYLSTNSCTDDSKVRSKAILPFTARMMQCVTETMYNVFRSGECNGDVNPVVNFQNNMKSIVKLVLILYVMVYGLGMVMGESFPKKSEIVMFFIKIGAVIYFAVGGNLNPLTSSSNKAETNGLQFLFDASVTAMGSFSEMIVGGDTNQNNLYAYTYANDYGSYTFNNEYTIDYSFLRVWDTLDCRAAFYLGFLTPTEMGKVVAESPIGGGIFGGIFSFLWGLLFSFNFNILAFMLLFGIMILSVSVYLVHLYIVALIALSITIFMGPIFVPMALFERTKAYFQSWLSLIIGYTLQPAIVTAFIMLMVTVVDGAIYRDCTFEHSTLSNQKSYWVLGDSSADSKCHTSIGYIIAQNPVDSLKSPTKLLGLFPAFKIEAQIIEDINMIDALVLCAFFAFLFYYFGVMLSSFASELSLSSNLGALTAGANGVTDKVKMAVEMGLDALTSGGYSKAKQVASVVMDQADNGTADAFKSQVGGGRKKKWCGGR